MAGSSRHWDRAGLERKFRASGRPWTVGDIAIVADGQWAVRTKPDAEERCDREAVVECRIADGRRIELTVEELARAVGSRVGETHRDEDAD
ncbi:hypothetical protein OG981_19045 [Streptomyces mirabilis]|uniref:hypothetical protein n=1 Tax=Streptomyces mirabilis TaxID=68239 RepID=UPI002E1E2B55